MKIVKLYSYKSPQQIWRILISESDKLIVETRDLNTKEVFFNCFYLENGESVFSNLQLDEKRWIGIENIYKEIIFFHYFPKPDMPHHKGIIAFDIASQKVLWFNNELSFLCVLDDKVYGFKQGFEERLFFSLDYLNGETVEDFGSDYKTINVLRNQAESKKNWSEYIYPKNFSENEEEKKIIETIKTRTQNLNLEGSIEYNTYNNLLFFNYHTKIPVEKFENKFLSVDLTSGKTILEEVLNANAQNLFTDSFFVYKKFLFLLKGKNEVIIYKLNQVNTEGISSGEKEIE